MAYEEGLRSITLLADSTIAVYTGPPGMAGSASPNSGKQYRFVKLTGKELVGLADGTANEQTIGILQNKPQAVNQAATVGIRGVSLCVVATGQTFSGGESVQVGSDGGAATGTLGTDEIVGYALTDGGAGELISVLLTSK